MKSPLRACVIASALLLTATIASAQTGPGLMLAPWAPNTNGELSVDGFFTNSEADVTGADVDLSIFDFAGRVVLDPTSGYHPSIGFAYTLFDIGNSDAALPDRLHDLSLAFGGSFGKVDLGETLGGEWQMGYTLGVGYAGTAPFNDGDAWYGKASVYAIKPIDEDARWLVALDYNGNRTFLPDVPLPAVTYYDRINETLTYGLGFPYSSLRWTPDAFWTVELETAVFISYKAKINYKASDKLDFFAAYESRSDAFTVSGGLDHRRLLFSQDRVELGLVYAITDSVALTAACGYAFGQEFDTGFDSRDVAGVRDLDDSAYIRAGVSLRF